MAITRYNPRTIWLGGNAGSPQTEVNDIPAGEEIVPGMLIERVAGEYVKHNTAGGRGTTFALDHNFLNKSYDEVYAEGDLMWAGVGKSGHNYLAWLQSGENVSDGDELQSAGNGMLEPGSAGAGTFRALEDKNTTTGDARIRVEVV
jgi:hypothetical protein